ncbi:MAG: PRD domain-containing protein [Firmicutes bacterium]|nr:PRD domain-containing protein [Bacillota bacterium]
MKKKLEVLKTFNNNVILAEDQQKNEMILIGRGIGFGIRRGNRIELDFDRVDKVYKFTDMANLQNYKRVIKDIDEGIIGISEEVIAEFENSLDKPLDEHIHIALTDHINFTIQRLKTGLEINNPFLIEIRALYPGEYALAERGASIIEERLNIKIPESEVGFIAMHIHAAYSRNRVSRALEYTSLINQLVEVLEQEFSINLDRNSINYVRFITHLRFVFERVEKGKPVDNPLLERIKRDLDKVYRIAERLSLEIAKSLDKEIPEEETAYLAIHLQRILMTSRDYSI